MSIGSAHAGEIVSPQHGAKIGETAISRMYRVAWLASFGRQQANLQSAAATNPTSIRLTVSAQSAALQGVAAAKAAVEARMQAIAAQIDEEMHAIAAGEPLRYRMQIDCSSKFVRAARPSQGRAPALVAAFGSDVTDIKVSVETCTVKVRWKFLDRDREEDAPHMRAYSVSVPLD